MITPKELREARHRADLTQAELAARLGVSLRTVTNWETAEGHLPERAEAKVMKVLGATISRMRSDAEYVPSNVPESLIRDLRRVEYAVRSYAGRQQQVDPDIVAEASAERGAAGV